MGIVFIYDYYIYGEYFVYVVCFDGGFYVEDMEIGCPQMKFYNLFICVVVGLVVVR